MTTQPTAPTTTAPHHAPQRPLLLLDVDGVLCPFREPLGPHLVRADAGGQPIAYDPALAGALAEAARHFDLVWATAWEHHANHHIAPLFGLAFLPVIEFTDGFAPGETWKLPAIKRFVGDRPFAWVDDMIGRDAHAWAASRSVPTLLLDIDPCRGLAAAELEQLERFATTAASGGDEA